MRVALDVSALTTGLRSGTSVYLYRLAGALRADDLDLHLLYHGAPGRGMELAQSLARPGVQVTCARFRTWGAPFPLVPARYPRRLAELAQRADVFHVGEFAYPEPRRGQAVTATVHDVTTRLFPRWHNLPNRLMHRRRLGWIARHATRVIIDAAATRADSARVLGLPPDRFDIVPLARGTRAAGAVDEGRQRVRERFGLGADPYVLHVGTLEPRKNLVRLVEAMEQVLDTGADARLVLVGGWGWQAGPLRAALGRSAVRARIVLTGAVDDDTLDALYAGATVFAYPSLYEGFGLPLLEAMAAGVPVVTSAGGALAEVAGDAAVTVDPHSVEALAGVLVRLLGSPSERDRLRARGRERERAWTWERTAALTVAAWARALDEAR